MQCESGHDLWIAYMLTCMPDAKFYVDPPGCEECEKAACGLQGQWNITAGQNDLFDTFGCQKHYFSVDEQGILHADINWRVQKSDGDFIERHADQTFKQVNLSSPLHPCTSPCIDYASMPCIMSFPPQVADPLYIHCSA